MAIPLEGLTSAEAHWIDYIRSDVMPRLQGTAEARARTAAVVTWWALKEGVLDVKPNPWRHSICHTGGDHPIGDLEVCSDPIWQVGMAGIQPSSASLAQVETVANRIYPDEDLSDVLHRIAKDAGITSSNIISAIVASTGSLKKAWLLRDPAVGFTIQRPFVESQCVVGSVSWCYGSWGTAKKFASSKSRTQEVVDALTNYFRADSGGSLTRWLDSPKKQKTALILSLAGLGAFYWYGHAKGFPRWFPRSLRF